MNALPARGGALGVVALNLGGPDSLEAVEPFLRNVFRDPDVIQLPWPLRLVQEPFARTIARKRAPLSRQAYAQIGGRSTIADDARAQAAAVCEELGRRGVEARPYVAMAAWHPFSDEAVAAMRADGVTRAVALPLYPQWSHATSGSSYKLLDKALAAAKSAGAPIALGRVTSYPDAPGFIRALTDELLAAERTLPVEHRDTAPVLFSAHGLPESYIRKGDPYLDEVRTTVAAVDRALALGPRVNLSFQSRVGRARWLGPYTEDALAALAQAGAKAVVVCPVAFTSEHVETLQEIDIVYREHAAKLGLVHFARARTVGCHPAYIAALADLALAAVATA